MYVKMRRVRVTFAATGTQQYTPSYSLWRICNCQQYKSVHCCHGNVTTGSLSTVSRSTNYLILLLKIISIKYDCLYFALVIRHTNRIFSASYYIVICGLSVWIHLSFFFFQIFSQRHDFRKKNALNINSALYYTVVCGPSVWFYLIFSKFSHKNMISEKMY